MRILLAIHNAYTDSTSGAAHSMRVLMQWLHDAGHDCRVLGTARFDARPPDDLERHVLDLGVPLRRNPPSKTFIRSVRKPANMVIGRHTVDFTLEGVPVTMLMTRAKPGSLEDKFECEHFLFLLDGLFQTFKPDLLLTYGGHGVVQEAMHRAQRRGVLTVFTLRNYGYEDRSYFKHVDSVFTCSPYLSRMYAQRIGLRSTGIESPIAWEEVEAPEDMRRFVTFVNPSLAKGSMLFARLADMLGTQRPDIPILVVQSATSAGLLNDIPGLDFGRYPHIMASPPTARPADFFALTRILLVPSTFHEPFGRVAAEALINGIPPLVSDRGALPETVEGAGMVIPLPEWLTDKTRDLPAPEEVQPWFDAVCALWDDERAYTHASELASTTARRRYSEADMRRRYEAYFGALTGSDALFADA
jgi:glycosyltransferase involved in cell wall biosynthesis